MKDIKVPLSIESTPLEDGYVLHKITTKYSSFQKIPSATSERVLQVLKGVITITINGDYENEKTFIGSTKRDDNFVIRPGEECTIYTPDVSATLLIVSGENEDNNFTEISPQDMDEDF